jgi:hypothetical protein
VTRKKPSVALLLDMLCRTTVEKLASRVAFDPQSPLLKFRLLQIIDTSPDGPTPLPQRFLKLDDRIVCFLLNARQVDARLIGATRLLLPTSAEQPATVGEDLLGTVLRFVCSHQNSMRPAALKLDSPKSDGTAPDAQGQVLYFCGPYGAGKLAMAEAVCRELGAPLLVGDVEKLLNSPLPFEEVVWLLVREAALQGAALCLENFDLLTADEEKNQSLIKALLQAARTFSLLTFLLGAQPWRPRRAAGEQVFVELSLPIPDE